MRTTSELIAIGPPFQSFYLAVSKPAIENAFK